MRDKSINYEQVKNNILFSQICLIDINKITSKLTLKTFKKNTLIYQQGEKIDGLYLIISGQIQNYIHQNKNKCHLSQASATHLFGEFLQTGQSIRLCSAITAKNTEVAFLSINNFNLLIEQIPETMAIINSRITNRLLWSQTNLVLNLSHLFISLEENIVRKFINEMEISSVPSNHLLIEQGTIPTDMFIVIHGRFQINKIMPDKNIKTLGIIGRGETIGEKGVILATQRSTEVRAIRDSTIAKLSRNSFEKILCQHPVKINKAFVHSLMDSFKKDSSHRIKSAETFTIIPLSLKISAIDIAQKLAATLVSYGNTYVLNSQIVDQVFNSKNISQKPFIQGVNDQLLQWLSEQEVTHQHVIYVADNQLSQWTKRCLRQTDHILFVVDAKDKTDINSFESEILQELTIQGIKYTLLILHEENVRVPNHTADWLKHRCVNIHHHVRKNNHQDFARVARFLTNNAISLVLGGGGARGFAHAGVIKAFHQLNIPIDMLGGNSMGAIIAAQCAMQWQPEQIIKKTIAFCLAGETFTFPIVSLFSGNKMTHGLQHLYQQYQIEDLWHHFFSISCNISRASTMTHNTGALMDAVLKSNTPPGLLPPQIENGDLLVDGALLNNIPVDIMKKMNPNGKIIAVDVNAREDLLNNTDRIGGMSGWNLLNNKFNPFIEKKIKLPNMVEIISRASIIGGLAQQKKNMSGIADLYLEPPVSQFSMLGYKHGEKIAEAGYKYAMPILEQWLKDNS
ncbi:MAG: cyclic nucleotide-binding and patatin-like phospholipase domain-containing protein [Pseudomonadota bacterium]